MRGHVKLLNLGTSRHEYVGSNIGRRVHIIKHIHTHISLRRNNDKPISPVSLSGVIVVQELIICRIR